MQWSADVLAYIRSHPFLAAWPDAQPVLERFEPQLRAALPTALPLWTAQLTGSSADLALPLGAAFILLHMAASVLDDFQDQDTNHPWTKWSLERVLGSTLAMVFLSQSCLARLETNAEAKREILDGYAEGWVLASIGQSRALPTELLPADYWRHALAKSAIGFAVAAWSGARLATDNEGVLLAVREFGLCLGSLLQIADDFQDFLNAPNAPTASALSASLPVVLAHGQCRHPNHNPLKRLLATPADERDPQWARAVCSIVTSMGGLTRTVAVAKVFEQKAVAALAAFEPSRRAALVDYTRSILSTDAA
jgi:geranylgeranyl pyrophosphate synthase